MKVKEKLLLDRDGIVKNGPVNIVFFGDSVTHGALNGYFDFENTYPNLLKKKLNDFKGYVPVNVINAGIGGTTAKGSLGRLDDQVIKHGPDLVVVCFGLNDVNGELSDYLKSLSVIFDRLASAGVDTVFMTPNMMNVYVAQGTPPQYLEYAKKTAKMQTEGRMDEFIYSAVDLAKSKGVTVCDCYGRWKELAKTTDTTLLLANRINHPTTEMHRLFADCLYEVIMEQTEEKGATDDAMFSENKK
jgi:lysophospholipase L1-like esterase